MEGTLVYFSNTKPGTFQQTDAHDWALFCIFISMKKYPIGIQDFRELRKKGYLYVDKTQQVYDLIESGKYYFLSRPRRFGKSLLISTLKYLFQGKSELFEGLWIEDKYGFEPHPVLHFSFSALGYKDIGLEKGLHQALNDKAEEAGFSLTKEGIGPRFPAQIPTVSPPAQSRLNRILSSSDSRETLLVSAQLRIFSGSIVSKVACPMLSAHWWVAFIQILFPSGNSVTIPP